MPPYTLEPMLKPQGRQILQIQAQPRDTNVQGDVFGGWLVMQMDITGSILARERAGGRVATVAIDGMVFLQPVNVGDLMSFHADIVNIGTSSLCICVEVWVLSAQGHNSKLTEGLFTFVAIDDNGRTRPLP